MTGDWGTISEDERNDWINAAVLIPCFQESGRDHLILTKRTEIVLHHKGQISFPGGAFDPVDKSLWETALRETHEEIGLEPANVSLIRELARQNTPTGFRVTPFVGSIIVPEQWKPNAHEIAEIFSVPFDYFRDRNNVRFVRKIWQDREFLDAHFDYHGHEIWGMTARILCEFFDICP